MSFSQYLRYRWLRKLKSLQGKALKKRAPSIVEQTWSSEYVTNPHQLPQPLMINLTSFPKRYKHLHLTLKSLLMQNMRADQVNLWLYKDDIAQLPESVKELTQHGLKLHSVAHDTRSYKKLIPALSNYPGAYHVTADDDIYYRPNWLETLANELQPKKQEILFWRAHRVTRYANGTPKPYRKWEPKTEHRGPSNDLFFTSGGGVIFPPGSLEPTVTDINLAQQLAPYADDLWWYVMARLNNTSLRRVGDNPALINWPDSREGSLWQFNKQEAIGNDAQLTKLTDYFELKL